MGIQILCQIKSSLRRKVSVYILYRKLWDYTVLKTVVLYCTPHMKNEN